MLLLGFEVHPSVITLKSKVKFDSSVGMQPQTQDTNYYLNLKTENQLHLVVASMYVSQYLTEIWSMERLNMNAVGAQWDTQSLQC